MKTKITFTKLANGLILAKILVFERGDYPTMFIFDHDTEELPENFELATRENVAITGTFNNAMEAKEWALNNLDIIESALTDWRNISVPSDREEEF
jgi:hypothetical protein